MVILLEPVSAEKKERKLYVLLCLIPFTDIITEDNLSKCIQSLFVFLVFVSALSRFCFFLFVDLTLSCCCYQSHVSITQSFCNSNLTVVCLSSSFYSPLNKLIGGGRNEITSRPKRRFN